MKELRTMQKSEKVRRTEKLGKSELKVSLPAKATHKISRVC